MNNFLFMMNLLMMTKLMNTMIILFIFSCNNWINIWINSELLLMMSMLEITKMNKNKEISVIFFSFQSILSSMMMAMMMLMNMNILSKNLLIKSSMMMMMIIKMGLFPFHWWMLLMCKMKWTIMFKMLFTLKIPSMVMINFLMNKKISVILFFTMNLPMFLMNYNNIKKSLCMLSSYNMMWFLMLIYINNMMWMMLFMIYMILNLNLFKNLEKKKIKFMIQINNLSKKSKMIMLISLMNLMNVPPMSMFLIKWKILNMIFINKSSVIIMSLSMMLITSTFLKLMTTVMMNFSMKNKWNWMNKKNKMLLFNLTSMMIMNT